MALNVLSALLAAYMLTKHGPGAVRFLAPRPEDGPRWRFAVSFLTTLIAVALLAASVNLLVGDLRAPDGK